MYRNGTWRSRARAAGLITLATLLGALLGSVGQTARPTPAAAGVSAVASRGANGPTADALPTVQVNGIVWTQVVLGNTVFAGGKFSSARPAGAPPGRSTIRRSNLLAFDIRTGRLISTFAPHLNGAVRTLAVSPDKKTLYVGGAFTTVNGKKRLRFAALSPGNGALKALAPAFSNEVRAIQPTSTAVFVGGTFTKVGSKARSRLAAITVKNGKLRPWKPTANGEVLALTLTPDRRSIVAGGSFSTVNRKSACGMTRLNLRKGAVLAWPVNTVVRNCGRGTAIMSLTADGSRVYGSGYSYGGGNYEGVFAASGTGRLSWLQDCRGDTYDVAVASGRVYSVGHAHNCGNIGGFPEAKASYRALAVTTTATGTVGSSAGGYRAFKGKPSPSLVNWFPSLTPGKVSGQVQAAWSVVASGPYVVLGGEFTAVNGVGQQGLVRMAAARYAPRKVGPQGVYADAKPTVRLGDDGCATVAWKTVWDRDDQSLSYALVRDGVVIDRRTVTSRFWNRTTLTVQDPGLTAGQKHRWWVEVSDPDGNRAVSATTSVSVPEPSAEPTASADPPQD